MGSLVSSGFSLAGIREVSRIAAFTIEASDAAFEGSRLRTGTLMPWARRLSGTGEGGAYTGLSNCSSGLSWALWGSPQGLQIDEGCLDGILYNLTSWACMYGSVEGH